MKTDDQHEADILDSWQKNIAPWSTAVQSGQIESRCLVTDRAIVDAVCSYPAQSVLDIGCGEGWLARELISRGRTVLGIDAMAGLVQKAQSSGRGEYLTLSYENIASGLKGRRFDLAVCNFSLLGKTSVEQVFAALPSVLNPGGTFIVQTLHPPSCCGSASYVDGWRDGSWEGFSSDFMDPAPFYFRTIGSWVDLFTQYEFGVDWLKEPVHPETGRPVSLMIAGSGASFS